ERAEALDQALGHRLGVTAGDGVEQHQLEQLVVGQRLRPAGDEAILQALAMPGALVGVLEERLLLGARSAVLQSAAHRAPSRAPVTPVDTAADAAQRARS